MDKKINLKTASKSGNIPNLNRLDYNLSPTFTKERETFIENLSILFSSGLDISTALYSLRDEFKSTGMVKVINHVITQIDNGSRLSDAFANVGLLPEYIVSLIRVGEETGKLQQNFKVISEQRKKEIELRNKIQSATAYPIFVLIVALLVLIGITWFILPSLSSVFDGLGIELPFLTVLIINLGRFMSEYGAIFVPSLIFIILIITYFLFIHRGTRYIGQTLLFNTPGIGSYLCELEVSRFGFYFGTLLDSGVPILAALMSVKEMANFHPYKQFYNYLFDKIEEGYTFSKCFAEFRNSRKYIPLSVQNMIGNAEKTGNLGSVFLSIGSIYENKTDSNTKNLAVLLEPILLIIVWLAVAAIAIGIILPIYSLIGSLGDETEPQSSDNSTFTTPTPTLTIIPSITIEPTSDVVSPTATPTTTTTPVVEQKIRVLDSGTGFVNVRSQPTTRSEILLQAKLNEEYVFISQRSGWYEIRLPDNKTGWISAQFVRIIN